MNPDVGMNLTEDEAELYDRQIRLWGLEAQQRLRKAKVMLVGISPTAAEIAKNIVLSGINSLTLVDDKTVTEEDVNHNFLLPGESVGENRAKSALAWCQELNPMVNLEVKDNHYLSLNKDDIKPFDLVCMAVERPSRSDVVSFNNKCREVAVKLIIVDSFGHYAFSFTDLIDHDFAEEEIPVPSAQQKTGDREEPPAKKSKLDDNATESKMVKKNFKFCTISEALDFDWSTSNRRILRRLSPVYFVLQAILQARDDSGKDGLNELMNAWKNYCKEQKIDESLVTEEALRQCEGIVVPVLPVVGGIVAQEIIKTVSHKDSPLRNFFFFNANDCSGTVNAIGAIPASGV